MGAAENYKFQPSRRNISTSVMQGTLRAWHTSEIRGSVGLALA